MRSVTDWQKSSRERKHIADVLEEPPVSTCTFNFTLAGKKTCNPEVKIWMRGVELPSCSWLFFLKKLWEVCFCFSHSTLSISCFTQEWQLWACCKYGWLCQRAAHQQVVVSAIYVQSIRRSRSKEQQSRVFQPAAAPPHLCHGRQGPGPCFIMQLHAQVCEDTPLYAGGVCAVGASNDKINKHAMLWTQIKACPSNTMGWCLSERLEQLCWLLSD